MDPMQLILSALTMGGPLLQPVAEQTAKDVYGGLKELLVRRFGDDTAQLAPTIDEYAADPDAHQEALAQLLTAVDAERDREIIDRATAVLRAVETAQPGVTNGLVGQINAHGGKVIVAHTIHGGVRM